MKPYPGVGTNLCYTVKIWTPKLRKEELNSLSFIKLFSLS